MSDNTMTLLHSRPLLHTAVLLHMNPHQVTAAHFKYSLLQPQNFLVLRILVTFVSTRSRYSRLMVGSTQSSWLRLLRNAEGRVSRTSTQAFPYLIYIYYAFPVLSVYPRSSYSPLRICCRGLLLSPLCSPELPVQP